MLHLRAAARAAAPRFARANTTLALSPLTAVSGLDGRYASATADLRPYLSEFALIKHRVIVELEWLRVLAAAGTRELPALGADADAVLRDIAARFDAGAAARVKAIEATTNHDVKAVEYYLKEAVAASGNARLAAAAEFLHFAATSEDVNNAAYALMVARARADVLEPAMLELLARVVAQAEALADAPMLSRTHGQPATPTTLGKEWANWAHRLGGALVAVRGVRARAKFNGAVGSFNAHRVAYPDVDWPAAARALVEQNLGLTYQAYSTQIESHDWLAELFHAQERASHRGRAWDSAAGARARAAAEWPLLTRRRTAHNPQASTRSCSTSTATCGATFRSATTSSGASRARSARARCRTR